MTSHPKTIAISNPLLKVTALIFGYAFWLILAQNQSLQITQKIPLSFYMPQNEFQVTAPSEITVGLAGKRIDLQKLDLANLGVHIDTSALSKIGTYPIKITTEHIFLPNYIKLLYYTPVIINLELS